MLARLKLPSLFVLLACLVLLSGAASAHAQTVTGTTSITLLPAPLSSPLSASNSFAVFYTLNGETSTAYVQGENVVLPTDAGSSVTISSVSTGSTSTEKWALDSQGGNVSIAAGSPATYYYYDLLVQSASYATSDGSIISNPMLDYYTAPAVASPVSSETLEGPTLHSTTQTIWVARGSQVSIVGQIPSRSGEQWSPQTSQWTVSSANQIPSPILYYHQFYVTPGYVAKGAGTAAGAPAITCAQYGVQISVPLSSSNWVDSGLSCSYSPTLPGSTLSERWAVQSSTAVVNKTGPVSLTYVHQYSLGITYSVSGGSPNPPTVTGTSFGANSTLPLQSSPATEWFDIGSTYSISNPLSSSSSSERWATTGTTSGVMKAQVTVSDVFYHQFLLTVSFSLIGGGSPTAGPGLSYTSFGNPASVQLTAVKKTLWADGDSPYSVPQTLSGSSSGERWYAQTTQGTVQASSALSFGYNHQFFLSVSGGTASSQWYNSSSTAQLSVPGVFGRGSGSGERVTSYSIDGGTPVAVKPTAGTVSISITMNSARQLSINSVQQYQVTLDASATGALSSITSPSITGDRYWYDQGTSVSLVLDGVWNRTAGAGERLLSYSLNGIPKGTSTAGPVDVLAAVQLSSPQSVTAVTTVQYRLVASTGSIATGTVASIAGDAGWYDSGTPVTIYFYHSWNNASGTRTNAVGYAVGGSAVNTEIPRSGAGTFPVSLTMSGPETITISSVTQYSFALPGGNNVSLSLASPTHDSFYDSGTTLTATTGYTWDIVNSEVRQNLIAFTLDSLETNVTRADSGSFTTPAIIFNGPHTLAFEAVTQDLVTLQFTDGAGTGTIVPTLVQIYSGTSPVASVPSSGTWLDNGTRFQIYQVEWEGTDVKPAGQTVYTVSAPVSQTIATRVYSGTLTVTDYLGLPISGAKVSVTLVNGTTIALTTDSKGTVTLREIPIGNYTASISYFGAATKVSGDAALAGADHAKVLASYPTFMLAALAAAVVIIVAVVVAPGRRLRHAIPPDSPAQHLTQLCSNCGAAIELGSLRCPKCGTEQV